MISRNEKYKIYLYRRTQIQIIPKLGFLIIIPS